MINRRLIRIKVLQVLYAHLSAWGELSQQAVETEPNAKYSLGEISLPDRIEESEKALDASLQSYCDLQHMLLMFLVELRKENARRIELRKAKYLQQKEDINPPENFVKNRVVTQFSENDSAREYCRKRKLAWEEESPLVRSIFRRLERQDFFENYLMLDEPTYEADRQVVADIYSWLQEYPTDEGQDLAPFQESRLLYDWALGESAVWFTSMDTAMADLQYLSGEMRPTDLPDREIISPLVSNLFREFAMSLLRYTLEQHEQNLQIIVRFLRKWDPMRIALTDLIILLMALAEALNFPNIPRPVTINEYIELARLFGTKHSPMFVNGVLDNMLRQLHAEGLLHKTGRGLINAKRS